MSPSHPRNHLLQLLTQCREELKHLDATAPPPPRQGTVPDDTALQWCADVYAMQATLGHVQGRLQAMQRTLHAIQGRWPGGPDARPFPWPEEGV